MRCIAIYALMTISSIGLSQNDSVRLVPVTAWKLSRLIDIAKSSILCDSALTKQAAFSNNLKLSLQASDELIRLRTLKLANKSMESAVLKRQAANSTIIHRQELKAAKKKARRFGFAVGSGLGLLVLVLVL